MSSSNYIHTILPPLPPNSAAASWAAAAATCCPPSPPPVRESACDAVVSIINRSPRHVVMPLLLRLLPVHACAGHDLSWRHSFESLGLFDGPDGQELRRTLAACTSRAPAEAAANALQAQLAHVLHQARDILGDACGPAHIAWAAANVGHDVSGGATVTAAA